MSQERGQAVPDGFPPDAQESRLLAELLQFPTGNAADALSQQKLPFRALQGMRSLGTDRPFAGRAYTVRQVRRRSGAPEGTNLTRHGQVIDECVPPGRVLVIAAGGEMEACTLGALLALRARIRGVAGIVIDGCVRDVPELAATGIPVIARGSSPIGSAYYLETAGLGEAVQVGGATVTPEDVLFGDATGTLVFGRQYLARVAEVCRVIAARERIWEETIRVGGSFADAVRTTQGQS